MGDVQYGHLLNNEHPKDCLSIQTTDPELTSFLTPSKSRDGVLLQAYDRNHGPIQHIDASTHRIVVKTDSNLQTPVVPGELGLGLSVDDLRSKFRQHTVTCALECAGNRRHEMRSRLKEVSGIDWGDGAVMNAEWTGPLLRDVLIQAGIRVIGGGGGKGNGNGTGYEGLHVQMECNATKVQDDDWYGGSIPLGIAMDADREVLLALSVRGSPPLAPSCCSAY